MNQEKIGKFIAKLRCEKKMTQQELALKIGVTDRAISNWENGRRLPDYSLILKLCEVLGISINELLAGEKINDNNIKEISDSNLKNVLLKQNTYKETCKRLLSLMIIIDLITTIILFITALNNIKDIFLFIYVIILTLLFNIMCLVVYAMAKIKNKM